MNRPSLSTPRIVVLGGGYAGVHCVWELGSVTNLDLFFREAPVQLGLHRSPKPQTHRSY